MDSFSIQIGSLGRYPIPRGALLRVGDAFLPHVDVELPMPQAHLLIHARENDLHLVDCSDLPPQLHDGKNVGQREAFLVPGKVLYYGSLPISMLSDGAIPQPTVDAPRQGERPRWIMQAAALALGALSLVGLGVGLEWYRYQQLITTTSVGVADTAMAMLAEACYGQGDPMAAFYQESIREQWLDRILPVDLRAHESKTAPMIYSLDASAAGALRISAVVTPPRVLEWIGVASTQISCEPFRPRLELESGHDVTSLPWDRFSVEAGLLLPKRLERGGLQPEYLYNAKRYCGFTWPLRQVAQGDETHLAQLIHRLTHLPHLALQAFPDRQLEKNLWDALTNIGAQEAFSWELSPQDPWEISPAPGPV